MICLIRQPAIETFRFSTTSITAPLGLAYVAGALEEAGRGVCVVDAVAEAPTRRTRYMKGYVVGLTPEEVAARIPADASMIGISVIFTHEWPMSVRLIEIIRERFPDTPIVLGGEHITSMPEFSLLTSKADILVLGEGEETVVELAEALEKGRPLAEIDGLAYREGEHIVVNRRRHRARHIDAIAWPAWHRFNLMAYHEHRLITGIYSSSPGVPILATRGCPYQCTYCSAPNMWTTLWVPRDPIKVVDEIQHYVERYGARNFPFQDLTAIIRKDWIVDFCNELLRRDLKIWFQFPTGTRSEAIDPEVAELMAKAGMVGMSYAPESGSETTRRLIKKKMTTEKLFASIGSAVSARLSVTAFMVLGFPHDTPEHMAENLPFVARLAQSGVSDLGIAFYMALPGTELFQSLYAAGKVRIDRDYFCHILQNTALMPSQVYCDFTRWELLSWKLKMLWRFYRQKGKLHHEKGLGGTIRRAIGGLRSGEHTSKLQTAFRNGLVSAWTTFKVQFSQGWMPRSREESMFDGWDGIYREIHQHKLEQGILAAPPLDTTELHRGNVSLKLRQDHDTARDFVILAGAGEAAAKSAATGD